MKRFISLALISMILCESFCACEKATPVASEAGAASTAAAATTSESAPSGDTIKIGVLTDRSSAAAATVKWAEAGAELAQKEINDAGGINGKKVELVYRDTASDSANVAQKSTELKTAGVVAILGPKSDGEAPAGAQWAETNKFPMITPCTMSTRVTIENASRYMFSCGFNAWAIARMNAKAAEKKGAKSAFFIGTDGGASGDSRDFFYKDCAKFNSNFQNLGSNQVSSSSTEFSNIISSVVGKKPDMIIGAVAGPNFVSLVNQGNQFGLFNNCDYYGWYTTDSTNTSSLAQSNAYPYGHVHGVVLWPFWMDDIKGNDKLVKDYMGIKEGIMPSDMGYTWYIGIKAIAESLKTIKDYSPENVTTALEKVKFSTIYGDDIGFRDFDHEITHTFYYVTADKDKSGKWSIPIGTDIIKYKGEDVLPTKEEMSSYAKEHKYNFKDLSAK
jgi:ABC-type branched-chain amino acid transport systems, periplasmic component